MGHFLLELGVEELPAHMVDRASRQLRDELVTRLAGANIAVGAARILATPRRLIVGIDEVSLRQPDSKKDFRGPNIKAAYDASGNPTPAVLGFCRGQGVEPSALRTEGDYVWVTKEVAGQPTADLLAEMIPTAIRALTFDKSMRWGASSMRFARPIRWMVAVLDGAVIPFEIEGVAASNQSRGHRFEFPEPFAVDCFDALSEALRSRHVEPDPMLRRARIVEQIESLAGSNALVSEPLLDENVHLTEWPQVHQGSFRPEFLSLPESVLVTAMAKHERFFPVRGANGALSQNFLSVRNGGEEATVRAGNEWVLNARFNDAKFFFDEDQKWTMNDFLARTDRMSFQEKLGSIRQRADRLSRLARELATAFGLGELADQAAQAGLYAKADLSSGLVSELASLQGVIGGDYARREGMPAEVVAAIATQYSPASMPSPDTREGQVSRLVFLADQIDKLAGYLGIGILPSGTSDPFGLRRAITQWLEITLEWPVARADWADLLQLGLNGYGEQGFAMDLAGAQKALGELLPGRVRNHFAESRYDLIDAALLESKPGAIFKPMELAMRLDALEHLSSRQSFFQAASRPINLLAAAAKKNLEVGANASGLDSTEGEQLLVAVRSIAPKVKVAVANLDGRALADLLLELEAPIHTFFESTMVLAEDAAVRGARLRLLQETSETLTEAGDLTKVVLED